MAITMINTRVPACLLAVGGGNIAEIVSMFADHQTLDGGCTVSAVNTAPGQWSIMHTYPGGSAQFFGLVYEGHWVILDNPFSINSVPDNQLAYYYRTSEQSGALLASTASMQAAFAAAVGTVRAFGGQKAAIIPAGASLTPATRTVAVAWPRTLPASWAANSDGTGGTYDVDIVPDVTMLQLQLAGTLTYGITGKTRTGCTLTYTNAGLILSLSTGTVDLTASK